MKKTLAMLLCLLMLTTLIAGCGAKSEAAVTASDNAYYEEKGEMPAAAPEAPMEEAVAEEAMYEEAAEMETAAAAGAAVVEPDTTANIGDKIIYSADLYLETTEFDEAVNAIHTMIAEVGGYVQQSSIDGSTRYNDDGTTSIVDRYAWYTIAVPSASFEDVLTRTGGIGNVISQYRYAENITSQYTDTEARVKSLEVQEERVLAMMEETTDIESLIALEARLSEITYEIESYQRTLNDWDRRVAYSTITINLQEVEIYTPTVPVTRTFGERLSDAFSDGWYSFGRGLQNFAVGLVEALPTLLLLAVIAVAVTFLVKRIVRRRRRKKLEKRMKEENKENKQ